MTHRHIRILPAIGLVFFAAACTEGSREWPERGFLLTHDQAVPLACLGGYGRTGGALPLGCANELNLTRMAEDPRDLVKPRQAGPAFAAPVATAAERYLGLAGGEAGNGAGSESAPQVERSESDYAPDASAPSAMPVN